MSAYALPGLFPPLESSLAVATGNLSMTAVDSAIGSKQKPCEKWQQNNSSGVGIVVREAWIDSIRLIQELSPSAGGITKSPTTCLSRTGRKHKGRKRRASPVKPRKTADCTPQENAMLFKLTISFNGQKYTAIRSLPKILQLRQDLIEEMEERRNSLTEQGDHWATPAASTRYPVTIPELPRLQEKGAASRDTAVAAGFVGRGFSMLHALLLSYAPVIEGWLQKVTSLVPPTESPSLKQFLWEPVSLNVMQLERGCLSGFQSDQKLTAIEDWEDSDRGDNSELCCDYEF